MRYTVPIILVLACFAALFLACYSPVLFQDRQFGFRDAGHYYYPLYQRVQKEWEAGRWPLWEPEENAGMPLLGNPTAAVLYPGKLIYTMLPYAWGARVYVIAHSVLAFVAMLVLMRSWQVSWTGSGLSALAYTFGVPILFQYCNVIYLVGAAWLPLGFHAVDRWVRLGRRWGLIELAVVLAMQTLGGDPQSSYLLGLAGVGYAAGLAWSRRQTGDRPRARSHDVPSAGSFAWWWLPTAILGIATWVIVTLILAQWLPTIRPKGFPPPALPWMRSVAPSVATAWMMAGLGFLVYWRGRGWRFPLGITWLGLGGSGGDGHGALGGSAPAGRRVHPADLARRGRGRSRHLSVQHRADSVRRAALAQCAGHPLRRKHVLGRRAPDAGCLGEGLGPVALHGMLDPHAGDGGPDPAAGNAVAHLALGHPGGQPGGEPGQIHKPDLGDARARGGHQTAGASGPGP